MYILRNSPEKKKFWVHLNQQKNFHIYDTFDNFFRIEKFLPHGMNSMVHTL